QLVGQLAGVRAAGENLVDAVLERAEEEFETTAAATFQSSSGFFDGGTGTTIHARASSTSFFACVDSCSFASANAKYKSTYGRFCGICSVHFRTALWSSVALSRTTRIRSESLCPATRRKTGRSRSADSPCSSR